MKTRTRTTIVIDITSDASMSLSDAVLAVCRESRWSEPGTPHEVRLEGVEGAVLIESLQQNVVEA